MEEYIVVPLRRPGKHPTYVVRFGPSSLAKCRKYARFNPNLEILPVINLPLSEQTYAQSQEQKDMGETQPKAFQEGEER